MKLLFLNLYDDPAVSRGGAEVTLWNLMRGLVARGHECVLLATSNHPGLELTERDGVRVWRAGIKNIYWPGDGAQVGALRRILWHTLDTYNPWMGDYIRQVMEREQPDVVSLHNLPGWSSAAWSVMAKAGVPSVQVLHDQYTLCPKTSMFHRGKNCRGQCGGCRIFRLPHATLSSNVSAVVGVSQFIVDRHRSFGYFNGVRACVINNARDARLLGASGVVPQPRRAGFRVGFIGRLDPTKGVENLLREFASYVDPNAELWIAGTGKPSYESTLRDSVDDARIRFLGRVSPASFYPEVDVVVVPSLWHDTFPGVVFESFAFGRPVIGARRGGIPEMIEDGEDGLLFDPDLPMDLLKCLEKLGGDESLWSVMSRNALKSAQRFLDVDGWVEEYLNLYRQLLKSS